MRKSDIVFFTIAILFFWLWLSILIYRVCRDIADNLYRPITKGHYPLMKNGNLNIIEKDE